MCGSEKVLHLCKLRAIGGNENEIVCTHASKNSTDRHISSLCHGDYGNKAGLGSGYQPHSYLPLGRSVRHIHRILFISTVRWLRLVFRRWHKWKWVTSQPCVFRRRNV